MYVEELSADLNTDSTAEGGEAFTEVGEESLAAEGFTVR